jgi:predicted MPP superfamily phosphohydrolase
MTAFDWLLAALALLGHFALCVAIFNRLHGLGIHRPLRRGIEGLLALAFLAAIAWYAAAWWHGATGPWSRWQHGVTLASLGYLEFCLAAAVATLPLRIWPRAIHRVPAQLRSCESHVVDVEALQGPLERCGLQARLLAAVPGNEVYKLQTSRKTLQLARLPSALHGLTLTHLSDLHFTGRLAQGYYDYVVDEANRLASDVIVLSGDIIESEACLPWITQTLARLHAPLGKYFVLGNHDKRMPDVPGVRRLLRESGWIDLGGRCQQVNWRDCRVLLAGNERPWFPIVAEPALAEEAARPDAAPFRLLVSHSPDQLGWARRHRFDLMLAGHNHGGQVCLPLWGPLITPSLYGTRYAAGLFFSEPTLLHVSRGIAGEHPLRWNCLPELAQLVLQGR